MEAQFDDLYPVTSGSATYTRDGAVSFTIGAAYEKYKNTKPDDVVVSAQGTQENTVITLPVSYLDTLPNGSYTIRINFTDGYALAQLVVDVPYYTITAAAGEGGDISPQGSVTVRKGEEQSFQITPHEGYHLQAVYVDDAETQTSGNVYTFSNVQADHSINVTFTKKQPDPAASDNGSTDTGQPEPAATDNVSMDTGQSTPATSDSSSMGVYMMLCVITMSIITAMIVYRKRNRQS